jgi:hypothetical protein
MSSGRFGGNAAWVLCAAIAHTCSAQLGHSPANLTTSPAARSYDDESSPCPPEWPDRAKTDPAPTTHLALGTRMAAAMEPRHRLSVVKWVGPLVVL